MIRPRCLPLLLGLWACGVEPPDPAVERRAQAVELWDHDPDAVIALIEATDDPVERIALVIAVAEAWPGRAGRLCRRLPQGEARERCDRIAFRAHLRAHIPAHADQKIVPPLYQRPGGGPSSARLSVPPSTDSLAPDPDLPDCADLPAGGHTCAVSVATRRASAGDPQGAAQACATLSDLKWRWECQFTAAESAVSERAGQGYADALELCRGAGDFNSNCQAHAIFTLAQAAPDASAPTAEWQATLSDAALVQAAWQSSVPELSELATDLFWSQALGVSYARTPRVVGDPLDALPEAVHRHVRAAATVRLFALDPSTHSLEEWAQRLGDALHARAVSAAPRHGGRLMQAGEDLWMMDTPRDESMPATFFLGTARRAWSTDPQSDAIICILEEAVREGRGSTALVQAALHHPDPAVAWTAEHLQHAAREHDTRPPPAHRARNDRGGLPRQ